MSENFDNKTIASFGDEWGSYSQEALSAQELQAIFNRYFSIFPWEELPAEAKGFDMGCGSGRWAKQVAARVGFLHCIDASAEALAVAQKNLRGLGNVQFHHATTQQLNLSSQSCDFGYSLGVLHHIPDTEAALRDCVRLLKPGAPFLLYLYYRFDNRPWWFRALWKSSDLLRTGICRLPRWMKSHVTDALALLVYWPLARLSAFVERVGLNSAGLPLSFYRDASMQTLRTDSRDRFGTPLEQRFTRLEISEMMQRAGLADVKFADHEPYWCAIGTCVE